MAANIFTDFYEHSDPDLIDDAESRRGALYALDANILINLYRYSDDTADQYLQALSRMRGSLFVPHQAIKEFWANRDQVRKGVHHSEAKGKIDSAHKALLKAFREWSVRSNVTADQTAGDLIEGVGKAVSDIISHIDSSSSDRSLDAADAITEGLNRAIGDQVGDPPPAGRQAELLSEYKKRVADNIDTPGAADAHKGDARSAGDFIFWSQCVEEAKRRQGDSPIDLTIVTDEVKEDWVRPTPAGAAKRARLGLVREYYDATGGTLRLTDRRGILDIATAQFGAEVSEEARDQVDRVATIDDGEWSSEMVQAYMTELWNLHSRPQLRLLIALAVATQELGWVGITKRDALDYVERSDLRGFTGAFQTPLRRSRFQAVNNGVTVPMVVLNHGTDNFLIDEVAAERVLEHCEDDSDYREYAQRARAWLNSTGENVSPTSEEIP